jgi:pilus assembly protein CpaB
MGALGFTLLALVFTGSTAFFLAQVLSGPQYQAQATKSVVVAARDLSASMKLKKIDFKEVKLPLGAVPDGAFKSIKELFSKGDELDRVLTSKAYRGEVIMRQRLSDSKQGTAFASLIGTERRGFPLTVEGSAARANLVYPGASIDVLVTMKRPETQDYITKLAVQNVRVLAVNGITEPEELRELVSKKKSSSRNSNDVLTLAVNPDEGERLALATREGKVDVLLRNVNDPTLVDTNGVTTKELTKSDIDEPEEATPTKKSKSSSRRRRSSYRVRTRSESAPRRATTSGGGSRTLELP